MGVGNHKNFKSRHNNFIVNLDMEKTILRAQRCKTHWFIKEQLDLNCVSGRWNQLRLPALAALNF